MATQPEGTTPGPWSTERCTLETDLGGKWCGKSLIVGPHASDSRFEDADARLISAAPDLYEALCAARDTLFELPSDEEEGDKELLAQIDAALAKAEGRDG